MLSVCIPVYNFNIEDLIGKIDEIAKNSGITAEIIIADDGSENFRGSNKKKAGFIGAKYVELEKNIGRAAIRNLLGRMAKYENLLFLDCDSVIDNDYFLLKYKPYLDTKVVVYGGTSYQHEKPPKNLRLHWNYGRKRETKSVSERNTYPARYFKTNNFLIHKSILEKFPFEENLKGYGHEDTLFGIRLDQNEIQVIHIDNPVLHAGLETNSIFLKKTEEGLRNLCKIKNEFIGTELLRKYVIILDVLFRIERFKLTLLVKTTWWIFKPLIFLCINRFYSIKALNFYKLGYLCSICK